MSPNTDPEKRLPSGIDEHVIEEMERIDDAFLDGLNDTRLESGVPDEEKTSDEEFLDMSGLTYSRHEKTHKNHEQVAPDNSETKEEAELTEPPLSFYEKGIADVDTDMTPGTLEKRIPDAAEIIQGLQGPSSITELRGIVADLSQDVGTLDDEHGDFSGEAKTTFDESDIGNEHSDISRLTRVEENSEERETLGASDEPAFQNDEGSSPEESAPFTDGDGDLEEKTPEESDNEPIVIEEPAGSPDETEPENGTQDEFSQEETGEEFEIEIDQPPVDAFREEAVPENEPEAEPFSFETPSDEEIPEEEAEAVEPAQDTREELPATDALAAEDDFSEEEETFAGPGIEDLETSAAVEEADDESDPSENHLHTEQTRIDASPYDSDGGFWGDSESGEEKRTTLGEAQALLEELESQPREAAGDNIIEEHTGDKEDARASREPPRDLVAAAERFSGDVPQRQGGDKIPAEARRKSHNRNRRPRRLLRYLIVASIVMAVVGVLAIGGYQAFLLVRQQLSSPEALLAEARELVSHEDYAGAMQQYERVAQSLPRGVAERAEALFGAACSAFTWGMDGTGGKKTLEKALRLLEEFQEEFPGHRKVARAKTLQGILYLELGQPQRTIQLLRHPELRLRDPGGAVPILRTLARAHTKLGEYDMARRTYLQAARLEDNYTPDEDYCAVSLIYEKLAEYTESPEAKREYLEQALEYWKHAAEVPGLDFVRADELKRRIALLESQLTALAPEQARDRQEAPPQDGEPMPPGAHKTGFTSSDATGPRERENKQGTMDAGSSGS
ncbi:MAG: hypothetical protein R6V12_04125 [Candidatus Hydrogenedentota bacterium]